MSPHLPELTCREEQVLELLSSGLEVAAIARDWGRSVETVREHADNARQKLGALNMKHAIAIYNRAVSSAAGAR